jgi:hypothetical protein
MCKHDQSPCEIFEEMYRDAYGESAPADMIAKVSKCHAIGKYSDGERFKDFFIFDSDIAEDEAREIVSLLGYHVDGWRCSHEHDCCGCMSSSRFRLDAEGGLFRLGFITGSRNV